MMNVKSGQVVEETLRLCVRKSAKSAKSAGKIRYLYSYFVIVTPTLILL